MNQRLFYCYTDKEDYTMTDYIEHDHGNDGIDRRGFLKCMAWAGTGLLCSMSGGILTSRVLGQPARAGAGREEFTFVQISDSHIGFSKAANPDVTATLQEVIAKINTLPTAPDFILHTGDLTQLSKADQFDTVDQVLKSAKTKSGQVFYVPGEHDVLNDGGKQYLARYGKGTSGGGWYGFTKRGVHFIGLVNVLDLKAGGLGSLGAEQLAWLQKDLGRLPSDTPIVVFAHIPLWTVYPEWGWGTSDSAQALSYLKRFGSVTVLNGHIHQTTPIKSFWESAWKINCAVLFAIGIPLRGMVRMFLALEHLIVPGIKLPIPLNLHKPNRRPLFHSLKNWVRPITPSMTGIWLRKARI